MEENKEFLKGLNNHRVDLIRKEEGFSDFKKNRKCLLLGHAWEHSSYDTMFSRRGFIDYKYCKRCNKIKIENT